MAHSVGSHLSLFAWCSQWPVAWTVRGMRWSHLTHWPSVCRNNGASSTKAFWNWPNGTSSARSNGDNIGWVRTTFGLCRSNCNDKKQEPYDNLTRNKWTKRITILVLKTKAFQLCSNRTRHASRQISVPGRVLFFNTPCGCDYAVQQTRSNCSPTDYNAPLCCIRYLLNNVHPNTRFNSYLTSLFAEYPTVDTAALGFPANWLTEPIWH